MALFSIPEKQILRNPRTEIQKPLMMKDFLRENSFQTQYCCESSEEQATTVKYLLEMESRTQTDRKPAVLSSTRSRAASAFQSVIRIVKLFPFSIKVSSPQSFSRSFSKKRFSVRSLTRKNREHKEESEIRVRVKDIMRWTSFGDEEISHEQRLSLCNSSESKRKKLSETTLDFCSPCSSSSAWSHSSACSECSCNETDLVTVDKNPSQQKLKSSNFPASVPDIESFLEGSCIQESVACGRAALELSEDLDSMETATCYIEQEKEQFSPVSVHDFPYHEEDEQPISFIQGAANMESKLPSLSEILTTLPLAQTPGPVGAVVIELRQGQLVQSPAMHASHATNQTCVAGMKHQLLQKLLRFETLTQLDYRDLENMITSLESEFFAEDLDHNSDDSCRRCREKVEHGFESRTEELDRLVLEVGGSWERKRRTLVGVREEEEWQSDWLRGTRSIGSDRENKKESCIKEMEKGDKWRRFEEEKEEMAVELESGVLGLLVEKLLLDLMENAP